RTRVDPQHGRVIFDGLQANLARRQGRRIATRNLGPRGRARQTPSADGGQNRHSEDQQQLRSTFHGAGVAAVLAGLRTTENTRWVRWRGRSQSVSMWNTPIPTSLVEV